MRSIIYGITIAIILITCCACGLKGTSLPEDFTLRMAWNTGSLPPKYRYEYVITVGSEGQGVFEYTSGYGDVGIAVPEEPLEPPLDTDEDPVAGCVPSVLNVAVGSGVSVGGNCVSVGESAA